MKKLFLPGLVVLAGNAVADDQNVSVMEQADSHETITVTANRVEESWLESAETITLLTADDIAERNITNVSKLIEQVPGVSLAGDYNGVLDINYRGSNASVFEGSSPIVVYVDGIPLSHRNGISFDINDIELVEAVRGPAGAIYGKNNIGGVINITTRQAQQETASAVSARAGSKGTYSLNGFVTTGIGDNVRVKLNSTYTNVDGDLPYADTSVSSKNVDREQEFYVNGGIDADIGDNGTLSVAVFHDDRKYGYSYQDTVSSLVGAPTSHPKNVNHNFDNNQRIKSLNYKLGYTHQLDSGELEFLGSSRNQDYKAHLDCDTGAQNMECLTDVEFQEFNFETRWSHITDSNSLLVGAYAEQLITKHIHNGYFNRVGNQLSVMLDTNGDQKGQTFALFGQNIWKFADGWQFVTGGRLQQVKKSADHNNPKMGGTFAKFSGSEIDRAFLPKAALSWQFNDQQSSYLSYNRGYLPGGYNFINNTSNIASARFEPQTSDEFELGYKFSSNNLMLTSNVFYMLVKDIHSMEESTAGIRAINIEGATGRGFEIEGNLSLGEHVTLDGGFAWVDTTYDSGSKANGKDVGGKRIEETPEITANFGISTWYQDWFARVGTRYIGDKYTTATNEFKLDSYQVWDASIGYDAYDWSARLWVNNLTDEFGVQSAMPSLAEPFVRSLISSRLFGIDVKIEF